MTDVERAQAVEKAEALILKILESAASALKPSKLITRVTSRDPDLTRTEIVEAVWRLREDGKVAIEDDAVRLAYAAA